LSSKLLTVESNKLDILYSKSSLQNVSKIPVQKLEFRQGSTRAETENLSLLPCQSNLSPQSVTAFISDNLISYHPKWFSRLFSYIS